MIQGNPEPPFEKNILNELRKWLRKMVLLQGYVSLFGGSDGGPHGDRWLIYVTWPQTRWVETKNVSNDNFRKALLDYNLASVSLSCFTVMVTFTCTE